MSENWWLGADELDEDQKKAIELPIDGDFLIIGPPGSGKSNLLLLRANYLSLAGHPNLVVLVFTRSLEEFLNSGSKEYDFDKTKIMTSIRWEQRFLEEHQALPASLPDPFEERRRALLSAIQDLIPHFSSRKPFSSILLDEAQDYWVEEIDAFRMLSDHVFYVADSRQKLYPSESPIEHIRGLVDEEVELRFHYRNGHKICDLADYIGRGMPDYQPIIAGCNYDESRFPSETNRVLCDNIDSLIDALVERLQKQLKAYPEGIMGVLVPRNEDLEMIEKRLRASKIGDQVFVVKENWETDARRVAISTIHSAKGLEFRCGHLVLAEGLKAFRKSRYMAFVAVTRAKTSFSTYHLASLNGFLEEAIAAQKDPPPLPSIPSLFRRPK